MRNSAYGFAVVCEAPADQDAACGLADRVLLEEIDWLDTETLDGFRKWKGLASRTLFLRWASVSDEFKSAGFNGFFGRFGQKPGEPDALQARKALTLLRQSNQPLDAVVLVRD